MLFTIIGVGLICYGLIYFMLLYFLDSDPELAFYEKFGKPISSLKDQVVFITGASSGIGEHTAIALAKHGVKLVLAARRVQELERVKEICLETSKGLLKSGDVLVLQMDVKDLELHQKHFDTAVEHFGQVDILFNNAGRSQRAVWENIAMDVDKEMFDLNLFSVVNLTRIAVKYFKCRGYGHVAVNSSIAGVIALPMSCTYSGCKFALHGYFNCLRNEKLSKEDPLKLTVTIICPGPTFTNFLQECFTEQPNQKYGVSTRTTDRRMTGERCGVLTAIALANRTNESWICIPPMLVLCYIFAYFPIISNTLLKVVGPKKLFRVRDSN